MGQDTGPMIAGQFDPPHLVSLDAGNPIQLGKRCVDEGESAVEELGDGQVLVQDFGEE